MQSSEYEALGRGVVRLGMGAMMTVVILSGLWVLNDLYSSWERGEVSDLADWVILAFAALLSTVWSGSGIYGLWRVVTRQVKGLDDPRD